MAYDVNKYPWYEEISDSDSITQGDIFTDCLIPLINRSVYSALRTGSVEAQDPLDIMKTKVVILSQACDIEQGKVSTLIACPLMTVREIQLQEPNFIRDRLESVRQGREPYMHLLDSYHSPTYDSELMIVDFITSIVYQKITYEKWRSLKESVSAYSRRTANTFRKHSRATSCESDYPSI